MTLLLPPRRVAVFRSCAPGANRLATDAAADLVIDHGSWQSRARAIDHLTAEQTLPFWYDHAIVAGHAGYRLGYDAAAGAFDEPQQLLVSQARLMWTFARAHRLNYSTSDRDYLAAARHGYLHLRDGFTDRAHGGFYWRLEAGRPADVTKVLYGHAFALYALVEFARASDDARVLAEALTLFRLLTKHGPHGSAPLALAEIAGPDFAAPSATNHAIAGVAALGYRCANTSLHWMEALTELFIATQDEAVETALRDSLRLNATTFYPPHLRDGVYYAPTTADTAAWPAPPPLSYGHNVEFGWLMIAAQHALGEPCDWRRLESILDHTLRFGFDHIRGGVFTAGHGDAPAHDRTKTWWVQAEMIAALTYLLASGAAQRSYAGELNALLDWYFGPQMDASTGSPLCLVDTDGAPIDATVSGEWQAAYHDLRARWIFIGALSDATAE